MYVDIIMRDADERNEEETGREWEGMQMGDGDGWEGDTN